MSGAGRWLVFEAGRSVLRIEVSFVVTIETFQRGARLPVPCALTGTVPWRDELVCVLEPALLDGGAAWAPSRMVVVRTAGGLVGAPASRVRGIVDADTCEEIEMAGPVELEARALTSNG